MKTLSCEAIARAALGEPLKREGVELLYRCPRRERHSNGDAHPSFKVNPRKNVWACFVCGVGGTAWQLAALGEEKHSPGQSAEGDFKLRLLDERNNSRSKN